MSRQPSKDSSFHSPLNSSRPQPRTAQRRMFCSYHILTQQGKRWNNRGRSLSNANRSGGRSPLTGRTPRLTDWYTN